MHKKQKYIVLYSSGLAMIIAAFSAWLISYQQNPYEADMNELINIQQDLIEYKKSEDNSSNSKKVMAWMYPGQPACSALSEAKKFEIDVIKPEYFVVQGGGELELMTESKYGCNGYSKSSVSEIKLLSNEQFVTVSASYAKDIDVFLKQDAQTEVHTNKLVDFAVEEGITGVELDFEDFGGWSQETYSFYKDFVVRLANRLHENGKELMIDLPAVRNVTEEQWYKIRLSELDKLPVDYLVIMAYDYQYDYGAGEPVAPLKWIQEVVLFTKQSVTDDSKIVIGIPSYGYISDKNEGDIKILTQEQAREYAIYSSAERDPASKEMIAVGGKKTLVYQDAESIQAKIDVVTENGINKVSIWHLGGNSWFLPKY